MATGKVKWFNVSKGFGFITADDGTDVFVHHGDIQGGASLNEGDAVHIRQDAGTQGPQGGQRPEGVTSSNN